MRVQGAKSINGISGGNASDNFTNTIVANSSNQVKMSFGENVDGTASYQTDPIAVTGLGIVNFTELNVTNGIKLMANGETSKMVVQPLLPITQRPIISSAISIFLKMPVSVFLPQRI